VSQSLLRIASMNRLTIFSRAASSSGSVPAWRAEKRGPPGAGRLRISELTSR
jgi:hypothetical protein